MATIKTLYIGSEPVNLSSRFSYEFQAAFLDEAHHICKEEYFAWMYGGAKAPETMKDLAGAYSAAGTASVHPSNKREGK